MSYRLLARDLPGQTLIPFPVDTLEDHHQTGSLVWLDCELTDPDELDRLGKRMDFNAAAIEDILDIEQMPKFDDYDNHVFVVLHALTAEGDRVDTIELDCFVADRLLVTVHAQPIPSIDWLWEAVQQHPHLAARGADELFAELAEVVGRRYFEVVNAIEARIDDVADLALSAHPSVLGEIQVLRREEATVRRMLRPQLRVISDMRATNRRMISTAGTGQLDDAYDVHNQLVESLAAARGLLTDALDTYRGASAERQANATTILAVYSAILLPLSLIASWYGMNVRDLPASEASWGWIAVTIGMLTLAAVSIFVFIRGGLIRLPRRRVRIRGLARVARGPVRGLEMLRRNTDRNR